MKTSPNTNGRTIVADPEWATTIDQSATPGAGLAALARLLLEMVAKEEEVPTEGDFSEEKGKGNGRTRVNLAQR